MRAAGRHAREVEAFAPDEHEVGAGAEARAVSHAGKRARAAGGVRVLVGADEEVVLDDLAGLRQPVGLDAAR